MKTVAYLRVSTGSQDPADQKLAVLDYARQKRFAIDRFVEAQASSRKGRDQRRIEELLGSLTAGDHHEGSIRGIARVFRAPLAFPGATDTAAFRTYVEQVLVPELHSGDVVVFDNLKPHLSAGVAASIAGAGARVLPLPPYSPDYTPIEEMFSKVKQGLRRAAARTKDRLYDALGEAQRRMIPEDILGWFRHAGLCATRG